MKRMIAISTLMALAGSALAQSFNVDLNKTSGLGAGVPASSYGAAAGQPGVWNDINSGVAVPVALKDLVGNTTSVTFNRFTSGNPSTFEGVSDSGVSGDAAKLLQDFESIDGFGTLVYNFNNLAAGTYAVYTYSVSPNHPDSQSGIKVINSISAYQYSGGKLASSALAPGVTHAIHIVTVTAGQNIQVQVGDTFNGTAKCGGLQLKKIDSARLRFYVDDSASGATNGTSWAAAFPNLQTALYAADVISGHKVDIWVAAGSYRPTTTTNRDISFEIPSGVRMYGGFRGDEATLNDRALPIFFSSILSGAIGGSSQSDNSYTVVKMKDCAAGTLFDGFSVARGNNTDTGKGGGFVITGGAPRISHCRIISNWAGLDGAGVYSRDSSPIFSNCVFFDGDSGGTGGGIYHSTSGTLNVYNCSFLGNHADGDGGAIAVSFADSYVAGSFFSGNDTSFGNGGAMKVAGADADDTTIVNCTFSLNKAAGTAGGVYVSTGSDVNINNSILWGNTDGVVNTVLAEQVTAVSAHGSFATFSHTTVQGGTGSAGVAPLFIDADGANNIAGDSDDNCRLQPGSPCIDAGDNGLLPLDVGDVDFDGIGLEILPLDLDYLARRVDVPAVSDTGSGTGPIVDRGAYEVQYTPPACAADLNGDGIVDFSDYLEFLNRYDTQDLSVDFNDDGIVDFSDYLEFLNHYDAGC